MSRETVFLEYSELPDDAWTLHELLVWMKKMARGTYRSRGKHKLAGDEGPRATPSLIADLFLRGLVDPTGFLYRRLRVVIAWADLTRREHLSTEEGMVERLAETTGYTPSFVTKVLREEKIGTVEAQRRAVLSEVRELLIGWEAFGVASAASDLIVEVRQGLATFASLQAEMADALSGAHAGKPTVREVTAMVNAYSKMLHEMNRTIHSLEKLLPTRATVSEGLR